MITSAIYFCVKLALLQLYPAYICYKAIKVNNQQEFGSLLTFWVVSISYLSIEYFSDIFLFWIPFYTEFKLLFVLWLILPQTQGASVCFTKYLDPFLHSHEVYIDNALLEIQSKLRETIVLYGKQLIQGIKKLITDKVFKGNEEGQKSDSLSVEQNQSDQPPVIDGTGGYIINPYSLFSTLITTTTNRLQQAQHEKSAVPKQEHVPALSYISTPVTSSTTSTAVPTNTNNEKLDRSDSHDSLQSYVNVKENTSASTTPDLPRQPAIGWGEYLSSWMKKPSSPTSVPTIADQKKND